MSLEHIIIYAIRAAKGLRSLNPTDLADRVRIEQAIHALKSIFFFPLGVRAAFEAIDNGEDFPREEAMELAELFRQPTSELAELFILLDPYRFADNQRINAQDAQALDMIRYRKLRLRQGISQFFASYASGSSEEDDFPTQAGRITAQIDKFNKEIVKAEKLLAERRARRVR